MSHSTASDDRSSYDDSENGRHVTDSEVMENTLFQHISEVNSAGSFATFDKIENFVLPGISVDPIGIVGLPLSEENAHALVQASHRSPFGKGTETLVDEVVRKTWEIDAGKIRFLNKGWQCCLDRIVGKVARELGVAGGSQNVRAEFYKMLLYEKGAMFKAHKDTEKVSGMFGTLVICLPSEHTGGAVCLQHGKKKARFDTSEYSKFDATFSAWYADVTHEIEPVQTGYRWVLTYNLINDSKDLDQSASTLDARIREFTQTLTQWRDLEKGPPFLAYQLAYQYTSGGLRLAQLKGSDYHRVRHVAQSCAEHRGFHVLLANMETCITHPNDEDETERDFDLYLTHIVDLEGFNLSVHKSLFIPETALLQETSYDDRSPDTQRGGEYLGNQHAEIEQFFNDSVMILVPKCFIKSFLLGEPPFQENLKRLISKLKERMEKENNNPTSEELLLQICQSSLSAKYENNDQRDLYLGPVAVAAVFMRDDYLFTKTVEQVARGFDKGSYSELGKLICLADLVVSEDNIIEALKKSGKLHEIYENLDSFFDGFCRGNPNREDQFEMAHLKRWLDCIASKTLNELTNAYAEDARTLVRIILERGNDKFRQFVLYQGVRGFVDRFSHCGSLTNALMVELLLHLRDSSSSQNFLEGLLQRILESAISNFDLQRYVAYVEGCCSQGFSSIVQQDQGQGEKETRSLRIGPIKAFYERVRAHDQGIPSRLLGKIQTQASKLTNEQLKGFLMPFLEEMLTIVDITSSEAQEFFQSLFTIYITGIVRKEPKKPSDWARPEEAVNCYKNCDDCLEINKFLRDPEAKTHRFSPKEPWHLEYQYRFVDQKPVAVTKTLKWWKQQHQEWESRASTTLEVLRNFPQAKLKECLALRYDEIMELHMVKVDDSSTRLEDTSKVRHLYQTESTVPQKRSQDDL